MSGFLLRQAADAEDEGGDVPGRLEDLPVRTGAVAGAGRASGAAVKIGACFLMSRDERIFFTEGDGVVGYQEIPCVWVVNDWDVAFELKSPMLAGRRGDELLRRGIIPIVVEHEQVPLNAAVSDRHVPEIRNPLAIAVVRPVEAVKSRYVQTDGGVAVAGEVGADLEVQGSFSPRAYSSEVWDDPVSDFEFERRMSNDDAVDLDEASGRLR